MAALRLHRHRSIRPAVAMAAIVILATQPLHATAPVPTLTAAFLYNFAKFTEWPADAFQPAQPLSMCVIGEDAVADALEHTIKGRTAGGRPLSVRIVSLEDRLRSCHLLYIGVSNASQVQAVLERLKDAPVFTVGSAERSAERGAIGQLFLEEDRMTFAINVTAAQRARLTLSSKLLRLAKIVKDDRHGAG